MLPFSPLQKEVTLLTLLLKKQTKKSFESNMLKYFIFYKDLRSLAGWREDSVLCVGRVLRKRCLGCGSFYGNHWSWELMVLDYWCDLQERKLSRAVQKVLFGTFLLEGC